MQKKYSIKNLDKLAKRVKVDNRTKSLYSDAGNGEMLAVFDKDGKKIASDYCRELLFSDVQRRCFHNRSKSKLGKNFTFSLLFTEAIVANSKEEAISKGAENCLQRASLMTKFLHEIDDLAGTRRHKLSVVSRTIKDTSELYTRSKRWDYSEEWKIAADAQWCIAIPAASFYLLCARTASQGGNTGALLKQEFLRQIKGRGPKKLFGKTSFKQNWNANESYEGVSWFNSMVSAYRRSSIKSFYPNIKLKK